MGYDLHITRAEDWVDSESVPITAEEWLAIVAEDSELQISSQNGPYFAEWSGPGHHSDPWFEWSDGQIHTKNPRRRELTKMLQIAGRLRAQVQGDDGEIYSKPDDLPSDEEFATVTRSWWKFW